VILIIALGSCAVQADNLLVNGDFSAQNNGFTSDYSFVSSGQSTTAGTYGIRTISTDFNAGYTSFTDHTSGSVYMMLLDGAASPSSIGWAETVAVRTNQTYYFSAWLASSDPTSPATVRVFVNGNQVGTDFTLSSNAGQWENLFVSWNSTTNTSALIALADENTVALGNDFALDNLSFGTNGASVTAYIYPAVEIDWTSQTNVNYQVQYSTALNTNVWINFGGPVTGTGATQAAFDSIRGRPQRFYRIQTLP